MVGVLASLEGKSAALLLRHASCRHRELSVHPSSNSLEGQNATLDHDVHKTLLLRSSFELRKHNSSDSVQQSERLGFTSRACSLTYTANGAVSGSHTGTFRETALLTVQGGNANK